jgi:hypothetical protein
MDNNIIKKENQVDNKVDNQVEKLNEIMTKIEADAVNKISVLNNNESKLSSNDLYNIMNNGADEFKKKTGRNMTYSEIRHLYG